MKKAGWKLLYSVTLHKVLKHANNTAYYIQVWYKNVDTFIGAINKNLSSVERGKKENEIGFPIIKGFKCICFYSFKIIS